MKVEVTWSEMHAVARCYACEIGQDAVFEVENLDRAGIGWIVRRCIIAPRHQNDAGIVWRGADLMGVDAGVELSRLADLFSDRAHGIDAMNRHIGRVIICDQ